MRSTSILSRAHQQGFTLIELLMALLLFSSLLAFTTTYFAGSINEARFLQTAERMKQVRRALVGDASLRQGNTRSSFGFNGDIGALPSALGALSTNPGLPAWAVNTASRIPLGWSGDYLGPANLGADYVTDAWGTAFAYDSLASPPTLTSLGADRLAGGTGLNADTVLQLPSSVRRAKIHGVIVSDGAPFTGAAQVELFSAGGAGALSTAIVNVVASDKGHFVFSDVPQGVRSVKVYVPTKAAATTTIGPVTFTADRPHYLINVKYLDVGVMVGPTNIEVPIEMIDYGLSSNIINLFSSFERTRTPLNTNDYDGTSVTYSFEIIATNSALLGSTVSLVNSAGVSVGNIVVGGLTNAPTRYRINFTPSAGSNDYRIQLPLTILLNQVTVTSARILVNQVNATKTKIYVPLIGDASTNTSNTDTAAVDSTASTAYTQSNPLDYSIWLKNSAKLSLATSTAAPYTFIASIASSSALGNASAAIYNRATGQAVAGASVTRTGAGFALVQASFGDGATNFSDLSEFEVRIKSGSALTTASIARAGLFIKLENLGKGEAYYRLARNYSGTASPAFDGMRTLINPAAFSNPSPYAEAVGIGSVAGATALELLNAGNNDSGTAGTLIGASTLALPAVKARLRSSVLPLAAGNRTLGRINGNGAATTNLSSGTVIVQFKY